MTRKDSIDVLLLMALTADGKIGRDEKHFPDWTGKEDKKMFKEISERAGVVIMGSKTFDTIGKPLPNRKNVVLTRNSQRVSQWPNLVYTSKSPTAILEELQAEGFSEALLAGGAHVNYLFAREGCIDRIWLTYSPVVFGTGISIFSGLVSMDLSLESLETLGEKRIFARYRVLK